MKTLSFILSILFSSVLTVHSQPAMGKQVRIQSTFDPKGILGLNPKEQNSVTVCNSRSDSIQRTLQAHQTKTQSKKITLSTGKIIVHITQTWNIGWVNSEMDSAITNSFGEVLEYWEKDWYNKAWLNDFHTVSTYDPNGNITSFLYQTWNVTSWLNNYQQFYTYDGNGHETSWFLQNWVNNAWVNSYKDIYTYNTNGYETLFVQQTWAGSYWANYEQYTYSPDAYGGNTSILYQVWFDTSWYNRNLTMITLDGNENPTKALTMGFELGTWVNANITTYGYDIRGHLSNKLNQIWSFDSLQNDYVWMNNWQNFYTNDWNGNPTNAWFREWKKNAWLNQWLFNYTYDASGHTTNLAKYYWSTTTTAWFPDYQYINSYDANGLETGYILQEGYTGVFENSLQHLYTYDANGNCTIDLTQGWSEPNWVNGNQTTFTYDANGNLASDLYQTWSGRWVNNTQDLFTHQLAGIATTTSFSVNDLWNMVSVPMEVNDYLQSTLFPTATSRAFGYQGMYVITERLLNGLGYWMKFNGAQSISMTGFPITSDTINVTTGWCLIGSLSTPISVTNVSSIPGGMITSNFFNYSSSYHSVDTIKPGQGYWVKVNQNGKLVFSSSSNIPEASKVRIEPRDEMPPTPPTGDESNGSREIPLAFRLEQNYPNPFNPSTVIHYSLPSSGHVRVSIYNMLGQEVMRVVDENQDAGYKSIAVKMNNLPSGLYTYRLSSGTFTEVKKMVLLK